MLRPTPLTWVPRKAKTSYEWRNRRRRVNHRLLKDDLELSGKDDNKVDSLVQTVPFVIAKILK